MKAKLLSAAALGLLVAACGTTPQDRVGGGAAAGAATGAVVGSVGGPVGALAGAGIGAAAGAATGAATTPDQVNLGRPVWSNPEVRTPATGRTASSTHRSSGRHGMAARSNRSGTQQASMGSRRAVADRDRAYMGGGMVVNQGTGSSMGTQSGAQGGFTGWGAPGQGGAPNAGRMPANMGSMNDTSGSNNNNTNSNSGGGSGGQGGAGN